MCDTIVTAGGDHAFFAKNSDREPGEPQFLQYSSDPARDFREQPWLEARAKYAQKSYRTLAAIFDEFANPYDALISRPSWMWGAEMGINERGLSIGNEAGFSRQKVPRDGLLGMDILRLALHNAANAREARDFITRVLEHHAQGGDGGYNGVLLYNNSFLLRDRTEAFVLESSGAHWASRQVDRASISNAYSLREQCDGADPESRDLSSFKRRYEDRLFTMFSHGNARQRFTSDWIAREPAAVSSLMALLRAHAGGDGSRSPARGTGSVCMHTGQLIKSETTASMIVDYGRDTTVAWMTGSPHPCVSLFVPHVVRALPPKGAAPLQARKRRS